MKDDTKAFLVKLARSINEFERLIGENPREVKLALEEIADDPAYSDVQEFFRASIRGMAGSRAGLTMGQVVEREVERHKGDGG